jgi:hypothetical protein
MDLGNRLTETVQFELPDLAGAVRLAAMLRPCWTLAVTELGEGALVHVFVPQATDDLAALLRLVEHWVERESLRAIRFELDGRAYVLEAGHADWTALPRPASA